MNETNEEILVIGRHTRAYLHTVAAALRRCGFSCINSSGLPGEDENLFMLTAKNYNGIDISMPCRCCELDPGNAEKEFIACTNQLERVKGIIVVLPIKFFAAYRYNVDDDFVGIEDWITPDLLQRIIHSIICGTTVSLSWVITGVDQVTHTMMNDAPIEELSLVSLAEDIFDLQQKADEVVRRFFCEDEEILFLDGCKDDKVISFGFLQNSCAPEIGEKTCVLWNMNSFWRATQSAPMPPEIIAAHL